MPSTHQPYAPEYRRRIIQLARAGRSINQLAREFEPSANAIRKWVKQAADPRQLDLPARCLNQECYSAIIVVAVPGVEREEGQPLLATPREKPSACGRHHTTGICVIIRDGVYRYPPRFCGI